MENAANLASKGSQRQIQKYVNAPHLREVLNCAIATALDGEFKGEIEWVSPLQKEGFAEMRDGAFLKAIGSDTLTDELSDFWPARGPHWDALACGRTTKQVFLIEAKSYPAEMRSAMKAGEASQPKIQKALRETALWLQVNNGNVPTSWTESFYQSANRLAHLYFLRRHDVKAFLLNVCFVNDTHDITDKRKHTDLNTWRSELVRAKADLGLANHNLPFVRNIFLPAAAEELSK